MPLRCENSFPQAVNNAQLRALHKNCRRRKKTRRASAPFCGKKRNIGRDNAASLMRPRGVPCGNAPPPLGRRAAAKPPPRASIAEKRVRRADLRAPVYYRLLKGQAGTAGFQRIAPRHAHNSFALKTPHRTLRLCALIHGVLTDYTVLCACRAVCPRRRRQSFPVCR